MSEFKLKLIGSNMTELNFPKCVVFFSYETPVAAYSWMDGFVVTDEYHSKTTTIHINKWLRKEFDLSDSTIKKMKKVSPSYFKTLIRNNVEQA